MKLYHLLLSMCLASTAVAQSSDPFVGTWVYSEDKSPMSTITYTVRDLGADRYALTGSSGETTEVKAGGDAVKSPSGETVSFKKVDAHTWHMRRIGALTLERTYTVSDNDSQLTLVDIFSGKDGFESKTVAQYHREAPGKDIYGRWKSFSVKTEEAHPSTMVIERFRGDGLTFTFLPERRRVDLLFDGKRYKEMGPDGPLETSKSGKHPEPGLIRFENYTKDKLDRTNELRVSADGREITTTTKRPTSPAVFTDVWVKK